MKLVDILPLLFQVYIIFEHYTKTFFAIRSIENIVKLVTILNESKQFNECSSYATQIYKPILYSHAIIPLFLFLVVALITTIDLVIEKQLNAKNVFNRLNNLLILVWVFMSPFYSILYYFATYYYHQCASKNLLFSSIFDQSLVLSMFNSIGMVVFLFFTAYFLEQASSSIHAIIRQMIANYYAATNQPQQDARQNANNSQA